MILPHLSKPISMISPLQTSSYLLCAVLLFACNKNSHTNALNRQENTDKPNSKLVEFSKIVSDSTTHILLKQNESDDEENLEWELYWQAEANKDDPEIWEVIEVQNWFQDSVMQYQEFGAISYRMDPNNLGEQSQVKDYKVYEGTEGKREILDSTSQTCVLADTFSLSANGHRHMVYAMDIYDQVHQIGADSSGQYIGTKYIHPELGIIVLHLNTLQGPLTFHQTNEEKSSLRGALLETITARLPISDKHE